MLCSTTLSHVLGNIGKRGFNKRYAGLQKEKRGFWSWNPLPGSEGCTEPSLERAVSIESLLGAGNSLCCKRSQLWETVAETSCTVMLDSHFHKKLLWVPGARDSGYAQTVSGTENSSLSLVCIQALCSELMLG